MQSGLYGQQARQLILRASMDLSWHVGDVIRKLREGREWKQEVLSQKAEVSLATVVRVEDGRETKSETIRKISSAFNLTVAQLYALIPTEKDSQRAPSAGPPFSDRRALDVGPPPDVEDRRKHAR